MMNKFAKRATAAGAALLLALGCIGMSVMANPANAKDPKATISLEVGQDGSNRLDNGALVGWNGWEMPSDDGKSQKVNFVLNEDGSGTWYSLTEDGIDGKTSGAVDKEDVGKTVKQVKSTPSLVDNVTYNGLEAGQKYTLKGALVTKFGDGDDDWGYVLNIGTGAQSKAEGATVSLMELAADEGTGTDGETPGATTTPGTDNTGSGTDGKDDTTTGTGNGNETTPGDNTGSGDNKPAEGTDTPSTGDNSNDTGNKDENNNNNNSDNNNTSNGNNDSADSAKAEETFLYTYYCPKDKKVYTRSVTNGKAEAVPSANVKEVQLDEVTGVPTNAVTASTAFVAKEGKNTIDNTFHSFDASNAWEWTFVAFEQLYKGDLLSDSSSSTETGTTPGASTGSTDKDENGGNGSSTGTGTGAEAQSLGIATLADDETGNGSDAGTGADATTIPVYTFPEVLGADTTPTLEAALADWQASINKGLRGTGVTSGIHTQLTIYTDPEYGPDGSKASEIEAPDANAVYIPVGDARLSGLALNKVVIWENEGGTDPVDALVDEIEEEGAVTPPVDDADKKYNKYTLVLFPESERSNGDDNVVVSFNGTSAANHIGNYGYFQDGNTNKSFGFELMGIQKNAEGKYELTYNIYSFADKKYMTETSTTMHTNVIGNRYLDAAANNTVGSTSETFTYDADLEKPAPVTPPTGTVTISFDSNGGTAVPSLTGTPGDELGNQQTVATPSREGYTFDGWWAQNGDDHDGNWGERKSAKNADGSYNITYAVFPDADVILYAKWAKNDDNNNPGNDDNQGGNNNGNNSTDNDNKNGLVVKHEDPKDLNATVFFMSADEAKAEGDKYAQPENTKDSSSESEPISQMGDIILATLGGLVGASFISAGVLYIYRRRMA